MSVLRDSLPELCVLWLLFCGQVFCHNNATESLCLDLQFRQARDIGSVMADIKTLLMYQSQHYRDLMTKVDLISKQMSESKQEHEGWRGACGGNITGLSTVSVKESLITVPCDGLGWIVVQRRVDNRYNFPVGDWEDYKNGFGNPSKSFWLGLANIYRLTSLGPTTLRVELESFDGESRWAEYSYFRIEGEDQGYRLMVSGYTGTAGDSLVYHNGMKFSTKDRDNDYNSGSCAELYKGAWWYNSCHYSNLNSVHSSDGTTDKDGVGVIWYGWKLYSYSYKSVAMKILIQK